MHKTIEPTILYFGTPVALISSTNPDGTSNLAPKLVRLCDGQADVVRKHRHLRGLEPFPELRNQLGLFVPSHESSFNYAAATVERASCGSTLTPGPMVVDTAMERR